ncbi:hypothetical protein GCM10025751_55170 [Haladaptatus pallidirubidus]|uniref:Uncharacterized protein n=1 Tax=Haladaptatus pallidirubidus TaxID=1008152 RepID=A0AAV3UQT6_9EURY
MSVFASESGIEFIVNKPGARRDSDSPQYRNPIKYGYIRSGKSKKVTSIGYFEKCRP